MEPWLYAPTMVLGAGTAPPVVPAVLAVARWLPVVLVAAAMARCGVGTARQAVAWVVSLLLLWLLPVVLALAVGIAGVFAARVRRAAPPTGTQDRKQVCRFRVADVPRKRVSRHRFVPAA
ncbi:hypothetical protein [Paeniglutamicibacter psychrophenolicus]|uniref:hypothetical protein n=1 Tax=Paeniglutamicibacter psychrophenolicus TaxID=257454 RepID=UPI002783850C|nr:hypothetical protein [Paeniglutamicibacter psychrophenolicus]MDQ0094004.1 hypothetical protein [Paeniglutamicibacter psychrophenolicus]